MLAQLNGINKSDYIYPNQTLLIPKAGSILYITAAGDTLSEIAIRNMSEEIDLRKLTREYLKSYYSINSY